MHTINIFYTTHLKQNTENLIVTNNFQALDKGHVNGIGTDLVPDQECYRLLRIQVE